MTNATEVNAKTFADTATFVQQPNMSFTTDPTTSLSIGYLAGNASTSGGVFIGNGAVQSTVSSVPIAIGYQCLNSVTTSVGNTAVGYQAGKNLLGNNMTVVGHQALMGIALGGSVAFGYQALMNSIGSSTGVGYQALFSENNATANNTAVGSQSLYNTTSGNLCSALGYRAGYNNISGTNIVCIGNNTGGASSTSASFSTAIGDNASYANFSNSTALGSGATCTAANQIMLGTATEQVSVPGNLALNTALATVSGSTSGSLQWAQTDQGSSFKRVIIYCNALLGTATITFTTAFLHTPAVVTTSGLSASLITTGPTTTSCVVTGATSTGFLFIEGF